MVALDAMPGEAARVSLHVPYRRCHRSVAEAATAPKALSRRTPNALRTSDARWMTTSTPSRLRSEVVKKSRVLWKSGCDRTIGS